MEFGILDVLAWFNGSLVPGIILGCVYALGAIGVSLVFSILRFAHFAHGEAITLGAYLALTGVAVFGLPALVALPFAAAGAALIYVGIDRAFYRPLRTAKPIVLLIASIGISLMVRSVLQVIYGPDVENYEKGIELPLKLIEWEVDGTVATVLRLKPTHIIMLVATLVLVGAMHYLLAYTRTGKAMRAMSDDPDLARTTGINTERVVVWTWIVAAVLAGAAGVLIGMDTNVKPLMGFNLLLPMFAAAILGGLGRPYGAILGGLVIGVLEEISTWYYFNVQLISGDYKSAIAFGIMVLMLIFRPTGIFKGRVL